ncbi:hypothetical protein NIES4074_36440 [Cylindrospermum sp. NIES-4074]|nr:hypothetical protein NIES4074_36440 [Cylindrospermum sp. NIES-4074]
MSDRVDLNDDDVLSMSRPPFEVATTFKISELMVKVLVFLNQGHGGGSENPKVTLFANGSECNLLQANGGGWRKGKVRFRLEFIPDEPSSSLSNE